MDIDKDTYFYDYDNNDDDEYLNFLERERIRKKIRTVRRTEEIRVIHKDFLISYDFDEYINSPSIFYDKELF